MQKKKKRNEIKANCRQCNFFSCFFFGRLVRRWNRFGEKRFAICDITMLAVFCIGLNQNLWKFHRNTPCLH